MASHIQETRFIVLPALVSATKRRKKKLFEKCANENEQRGKMCKNDTGWTETTIVARRKCMTTFSNDVIELMLHIDNEFEPELGCLGVWVFEWMQEKRSDKTMQCIRCGAGSSDGDGDGIVGGVVSSWNVHRAKSFNWFIAISFAMCLLGNKLHLKNGTKSDEMAMGYSWTSKIC